jgi:hypothetical protein
MSATAKSRTYRHFDLAVIEAAKLVRTDRTAMQDAAENLWDTMGVRK